ncbi:tetratricopeptide repeat protein [Luteococcus sp.]|uniref:tetratricopeptide repeat protein n=1 Tax=Luteococcus sp. TaxID=1969402 RepID=UPI00373600D0
MTNPEHRPTGLDHLGLPAGATADQVRATRDRIVALLDQAPAELQPWAQRQKALAERSAQAALTDTGSPEQSALAEDLRELGLDDDAVAPATAAVAAPAVQKPSRNRSLFNYLSLAALAAAIVMGVYLMGDRPQEAQPQAAASSAQPASTPKPADPKMVATLEKKIAENPKDVLSMRALGQIYDGSGEYDKAAQWQQRITQVDPKDVDAWLALGVAQFNAAKLDEAAVSWNKAAALAPKRAEIYYNLGFLHMSRGDMAKANQAWQKVVDIAPESQLAKTVKSHLSNVSATPSAATTPSAAATPSR